MTLFEYLSVAFAIVLSLAAVRLLSGLSVAFLKGRRYWPHALWLVFSLLGSAMVWWNLWSFRSADWNFLSFLLVLTLPAAIYMLAAALVPENPGQVTSWHDHFHAARTRFFGSLCVFFVLVLAITWLLLDVPLRHPSRGAQALAFALALSGAVSRNRRLHEVLPVLFLVILSIAATVLFSRPNALMDIS